MSAEQFNKNLSNLLSLIKRHNISLKSIIDKNFIPKEVELAYSKTLSSLKNEKNDAKYRLWKILSENIELDAKRITKYYLWDIAVEEKDNLAYEKYPELKTMADKDGLFELNHKTIFNKNGFRYKKHFLIFSSEFSRNFHFTEWLKQNWTGQFSFYVPFDSNKLGLPETCREMFLASHWHGPKSIQHIQKSLNNKEYLVKGPSNFKGCLQDKTEFLFKKYGHQWHLQIEELLPLRGLSLEKETMFKGKKILYFTRYLHAITNDKLTECYHIDGALREYKTKDKFIHRNSMQINDFSKKQMCNRYKIFKIQSKEGISSFQEIVGLFFDSNPYIIEFFEGENEDTKYMERIRTSLIEPSLKSHEWVN